MNTGYKAFFRRRVLLFLVLFLLVFAGGCSSSLTQAQIEPRYTYHEFDGIVVFYKTQDLDAYKALLPAVFEMPAKPLVMAFVIDYYKMDKATQPYKEAAVYLLATYQGKPAWHCVTMPVTSDDARIGGITTEEREWFKKLKAIPQLNILNGKVYEPRFGSGSGGRTLPEIAETYPDKFQLEVGRAELFMDPLAAGEYSARLGSIFGIRPQEIVLAYYFKNKFVSSFQM
jgi:hypothetical protein